MKNYSISVTAAFAIATVLCFGSVISYGQVRGTAFDFAQDVRPFDFADKYYEQNGVRADSIIGRKNGADGDSVFDFINDPIHNNVRITETMPAYTSDGDAVFWNYYGGVNKEGFTEDANGGSAVDLSFTYPMYVFPSTKDNGIDRQAAMLRVDKEYYDKNSLGIAAVIMVHFTDLIHTKSGTVAMKILIERNGVSADGTPIIRTFKELTDLASNGFVSLEQAGPNGGWERTSFAIAKAIKDSERGAITADAFLEYTKEAGGKALAAEMHFVTKFECIQSGKKPCM